MSNKLATLISIIFHPIWFPFGLLLFYLSCNPIAFGLSEPFQDMVLVLQTLITCTILPLVSILVMWKINLISSLHMDDRMERIGPYIAMMIFLVWYYLNIDQYGVAPVFRLYILGGIISLFLTFFVNLFMKVSLHAAGISGVITNLVIAQQKFSYSSFVFSFGDNYYELSFQIILIIALLILFIVLLSRFYLRKHSLTELFGGLVLGFFGQILAVRLIDII